MALTKITKTGITDSAVDNNKMKLMQLMLLK
jgi:hypothetical protein